MTDKTDDRVTYRGKRWTITDSFFDYLYLRADDGETACVDPDEEPSFDWYDDDKDDDDD